MSSALYVSIGSASLILLLTACSPNPDVRLELGEAEDYMEFLEERDDVEKPKPFKAEPLFVSATGKVEARPDIAVITALISAEDKTDSIAVNAMSLTINKVQEALKGQMAETGFTTVRSNPEYDEICINHNYAAQRRQNEIQNDYWFNRNLDRRGDQEIKRRAPKPRIDQKTCKAQTIKVSTSMVIRIQPAQSAGDVLQALSEAGVGNARLYGYDFSDYDALYQDAAQKAVTQARKKAQNIAKIAGAELGELEKFTITRPTRTGRFGPQPHIIRPQKPPHPTGSAVERHMNNNQQGRVNHSQYGRLDMADEIIVTATKRQSTYAQTAPQYKTTAEAVVVQEASTELVTFPNGMTQERTIPAVTKMETRRVVRTPASTTERVESNTLSMSLLSGPQTITVTANLAYDYETPLDGKIIVSKED